jgi:hypothetical protein
VRVDNLHHMRWASVDEAVSGGNFSCGRWVHRTHSVIVRFTGRILLISHLRLAVIHAHSTHAVAQINYQGIIRWGNYPRKVGLPDAYEGGSILPVAALAQGGLYGVTVLAGKCRKRSGKSDSGEAGGRGEMCCRRTSLAQVAVDQSVRAMRMQCFTSKRIGRMMW